MLKSFCSVLALLVVLAPFAAASAVTDEEVSQAIERLKDHLYRQQSKDGGWYHEFDARFGPDDKDNGKNEAGETAIAVLALLVSGESPEDPRLAKGLNRLREAEMQGIYAMSLRAHVWSYLPDEWLPLLSRDAEIMLAARQSAGTWDYFLNNPSSRRLDHSTTQYGYLGLWQAAKRGVRMPNNIWSDGERHFLEKQFPDGGWAYSDEPSRKPTPSMTCAGLTVLHIVQQELYRKAQKPNSSLRESIDAGLGFMDKKFSATTSVHSGSGYFMYGVERVGLATGRRYFGGKDWFDLIATRIVATASKPNGLKDVHNAAFYLMFLSRGRVPVWVSKLEVPGIEWNNRPNDIYFLTRYLSDLREHELNWQVVPIDTKPTDWLNAPILYLSTPDAIELEDAQKEKLKSYIDHGGLLLLNPEGGSGRAVRSAAELAKALYPNYEWKELDRDHPFIKFIYDNSQDKRTRIMGLSNGVRDLILMPSADWGYQFQAEERQGVKASWKYMTNLYAMVTDRGRLTARLVSPVVKRDSGQRKSGDAKVYRISHEGNWEPEPLAYSAFKNVLFNATGVELSVETKPLADLGSLKGGLAHLSGVEAITLTEDQKAEIKKFVDAGGTLLIETVGGRGDFAGSMEKQLTDTFGVPVALPKYHQMMTGQGISGGANTTRVAYRPFSVLNMAARTSPRMSAWMVDNRPAVILTSEDLTLGMLGVRYWGINGYQPDSARDIMRNIVLYAGK